MREQEEQVHLPPQQRDRFRTAVLVPESLAMGDTVLSPNEGHSTGALW